MKFQTIYFKIISQDLEGDLFYNLNNIIAFFNMNLGNKSLFDKDSWKRHDQPNYPVAALREAILKACKEFHLPPPVWKSASSLTSIIFSDISSPLVFSEGINEGVSEGVSEGVKDPLYLQVKTNSEIY